MNKTTTAFFRAATAVIAPTVLLVSFIYHPHVGNPIDADFLEELAAAVVADTTRWAVAHLMAALGSLLLMLAFLAVRGHLREAGDERWSTIGLPLVIIGSTLYAFLPAMEFAPMAAAETGADVQAIQGALMPWFVPILLTSAAFYAAGAICFAKGIVHSGVLSRRLTWLVVGALLVMAAARFVPLNAVQFYVQGVAGLVVLWPLAYVMWTHPVLRPVRAPQPTPTT